MNRDSILVFDSGVGGISVLRHLKRLMPREHFVYFGDNANAPYGVRSTQQVQALTLAAVEMLLTQYPTKALVVACNTATSAAIGLLREKYPSLIVIGIEPAFKPAADRFPTGHIGIMATAVTLREKKLQDLMARYGEKCTVSCIPAPGLVELVEAGKGDSEEADALLRPILTSYAGRLDALVLGCTHYPFARKAILRIMGENLWLPDGGEGTARETRRRLAAAGRLYEGQDAGTVTIRSSGRDLEKLALSLLEQENL